MKKLIFNKNCTCLEYNFRGWNVGDQVQAWQQRLGLRVVERLCSGMCRSVNRLCIQNANQLNISANQIEN